MESTAVIGLAVVVVGVVGCLVLLFGHRVMPLTQPSADSDTSLGTLPLRTASAAATDPAIGPKRGSDGGVSIRWYQRVRSGVVLAVITVGLGMAMGAAIGAVAIAFSLVLG